MADWACCVGRGGLKARIYLTLTVLTALGLVFGPAILAALGATVTIPAATLGAMAALIVGAIWAIAALLHL